MAKGIKRFTSIKNLESIRHSLWGEVFLKYERKLAEKGLTWPRETLVDEEFYEALKKLFLSPKQLPEELVDFLDRVAEMGNEPGEARLRNGMDSLVPTVELDQESSLLEIALQIGLAHPDYLREKHSEHEMVAVSSFHYFGTKTPKSGRLAFKAPGAEARAVLEAALDETFTRKLRGRNTVRVTPHEMDGEYWYVVEHGGALERKRTNDGGKREVLSFHLNEHDLVVYDPARDEVRIHGGNAKWQRELYRQEFGKFLRGALDYFSLKKGFTLDPLRDDLEEALSTKDFPGLGLVRLVELGICYDGEFGDKIVIKSRDRVASAARLSEKTGKRVPAVPDGGRLAWAVFEIGSKEGKKGKRVHLRLPNTLRVPQFGDVRLILEWLTDRGFRDCIEDLSLPGQRGTQPAMETEPALLPALPGGRPGAQN